MKLKAFLNTQKLRFLIVGGFNSAFGYFIFLLVNLTLGSLAGYLVSLVVAQVISASVAYMLYRALVFKEGSRGFRAYAKFQSVYIVPLAVNMVALPILVELLNFEIYLAQAVFSLGWIVASFFVHKNFSFRK
jgi:putative flippase GtrA